MRAAPGVVRGSSWRATLLAAPELLAARCARRCLLHSHACRARQVWDDQHLPNIDFSLICSTVLQGAYTVQDVNQLEKQVAAPATSSLPPPPPPPKLVHTFAPPAAALWWLRDAPRRAAVGGSFSS